MVDGNATLIGTYALHKAPESFSLIEVYYMNEPVRPRRGSKRTKTTKTADIELELTPKRVPKPVVRHKRCYQPHGHLVCDAPALVSNKRVPVCTLRCTPGVRTMKCCMHLRWCVVLPPTLIGDAQKATTLG